MRVIFIQIRITQCETYINILEIFFPDTGIYTLN